MGHPLEPPQVSVWKKIKTAVTGLRILNKLDYAAIRRNVIIMHDLPENFIYYKYVRKTLQETIILITEIDTRVWLSIEGLIFLCFFVNLVTGSFGRLQFAILFFIIEYILVGVSVALIIKSKFIIRGLAKMEIHTKTPITEEMYDFKPKRGFVGDQRKTFCPCTMPNPSHTSKLFWLNSKGFFRGLIQFILLIQALNIAVVVLLMPRLLQSNPVLGPVGFTLLGIAMVWIIFAAIPYLVPVYCLCAYSAEYANRKIIRSCMVKSIDPTSGDVFVFNADQTDSHHDYSSYVPPQLPNKSIL